MRYFKPELLARFRSLDDDVADAAAKEWERATAQYKAKLAGFRSRLPLGARSLLRNFTLHDATLLSIAVGEKSPTISLFIRLEGSPERNGRILELQYTSPEYSLRKYGDIDKDSPDLSHVLYDEFSELKKGGFAHSLLLALGIELRIHFTNLRIRQMKRLIMQFAEAPELQTPNQTGL
jgi:hypothetical protein